MSKLIWDAPGEHTYQAGVDRGVLHVNGVVVPWSGLVSVTESTEGGEPTPYYIDGVKYLNVASDTEFNATIEAITYPDEFAQCDGTVEFDNGLFVTNQDREPFDLVYRTKIGNDLEGIDYGYKIHIVYGALASPSEMAYTTLNDTPELSTFSWDISTTPPLTSLHKPTAHFIIDSTKTPPDYMAMVEEILYGRSGSYSTNPYIPSADDLVTIFGSPVPLPGFFDGGAPGDRSFYIRNAGFVGSVADTVVDIGFLDTQEGFLISDASSLPTVEERFVDGGAVDSTFDRTFDGGAL